MLPLHALLAETFLDMVLPRVDRPDLGLFSGLFSFTQTIWMAELDFVILEILSH